MAGGPVPINISAGQETGVSDLAGGTGEVINWDIDEAGANRTRAPLETYSVTGIASTAINGLARWDQFVVVTYTDGTWARISDGTPYNATALNDSTDTTKLLGGRRPTFVIGTDYVYATAGLKPRRWNGGLAQELTNAPNCTHIASIGNYLIANPSSDTDSFQWSDIGEGVWTTWPAANTTTASARPDPILGIFGTANELFVYGTETLQVYQVGNDPDLPFDLVAASDVGLGAPYAFCLQDDGVAWLDHKLNIRMGDGRTSEDISGPIRRDIRSLSTVDDCFMWREETGRTTFLVVRFPTAQKTFCYDLHTKKWTQRKRYSGSVQSDYDVGAYITRKTTNFGLEHIVGLSRSSGGLALINDDATSRQDLGGALVCERTTNWHDHGTQTWKRSGRIQVVMRRGLGAISGDIGALEVRKQDDDGPWSDWEQVSVGRPDEYENTVDVFLGGVFRRRRYGFRWSSSEDSTLAAAYDDIEVL